MRYRGSEKERKDRTAAGRKWYRGHRSLKAEYNRKWRDAHPGYHAAAYQRWKNKNPDSLQFAHIRRRYGLSKQEYEALLRSQNGCCAICRRLPGNSMHRHLVVDHPHNESPTTIRGLLCGQCNTGLGQFRDNPEFLFKAAAYLLSFGARNPKDTNPNTQKTKIKMIK